MILGILAIVALFVATRLYNLGLLPLTGSEATAISWGLQAQHARDWSDWLVAVREGAQPLHSWLLVPVLGLPLDRVQAARLLSVSSGAVTLVLVYLLTRRLFGRAQALAAALLFVCTPLTLVHDRFAFSSALLGAAALLVLWRTLNWCEQPGGKSAATLGLALGAALLTSLHALSLLLVIPGAALIWRPASLRRWWTLANAYMLAGLLFSVVYTDPFAGADEGAQSSGRTAPKLATGSSVEWMTSTWALGKASRTYLTEPFFVLLGGGLAAAGSIGLQRVLRKLAEQGRGHGRGTASRAPAWPPERSSRTHTLGNGVGHTNGRGTTETVAAAKWRGLGVCSLWAAGSAIGMLAGESAPASADLVFVAVAAFPVAGLGLSWLAASPIRLLEIVTGLAGRARPAASWRTQGATAGTVLGLCLGPAAVWDWSLLTNPTTVAWHADSQLGSDRARYIEGQQSGYGLPDLAEHLREAAAHRPIVVFTEDIAGMPRDGLRALLSDTPMLELAVSPQGVPVAARLAQRLGNSYRAASTGAMLFYLVSDSRGGATERTFRDKNPGVRAVKSVVKPGGASRLVLYEIPWQPPGNDRWLNPVPRFGDRIALRGYALTATTYRAEGTVEITLYWEAEATPAASFTVFTHIVTDDPGQKIGQLDQLPLGGGRTTTTWRPREIITDTYAVQIDPNAPPGAYRLIVGMYRFETLARLPVSLGSDPLRDSSYELAEIILTSS